MNIILQRTNWQTKNCLNLIFCLLLFLLPLLIQAQWQPVGNLGFTPGSGIYPSLAFDGITPYVAFRDGANSNKVSVMKFDGTIWSYVGTSGFSAGNVDGVDIAMDGSTPYVVFTDDSNSDKVSVMKFDGTIWDTVGVYGFSTGGGQYPSIEFDGTTPYVSYADWTQSNKATVKKFDGTNWVTLGVEGFSPNGTYFLNLKIENGIPYIGYRGGSNQRTTVMKYDGTNWQPVGTSNFSPGAAGYPSLAVNGTTPYLAFWDDTNGARASVMKYDGTNWVYVGTPGFSTSAVTNCKLEFNSQDSLYVTFTESGYGFRIMKFDGTDWVDVGSPGFNAGSIFMDTKFEGKTPYIVYYDGVSPNKLNMYKIPTSDCSSDRPIPTKAGTYTSVYSEIHATSINYCDEENQLLLSLIIGSSGAVVEDNQVQLKIGSPLASFYQQDCSVSPGCFIDIPQGSGVMNRSWEVTPTTQPTNGNVVVHHYFTQEEFDTLNSVIDNEGQTMLTYPNELWFYKVTNSALGLFPPIETVLGEDVQILQHDLVNIDTNKWHLSLKPKGNEYDYIASFTVSSFSGGGGGGSTGGILPLPIELIYFHAYADNRNAKLKWSTASETNNQGFEIQRSNDGNRWEVIGFENGKGNTNTISNYSFTDKNPNGGLNYYRLKQIDTDGKSEFLPIKTVDMENISATEIDIYPNPAHDFLNITNVKGKGMIYNISGQLQFEIDLEEEGINTIDVSRLEQGIYQLVLEKENGERYVKRFFK